MEDVRTIQRCHNRLFTASLEIVNYVGDNLLRKLYTTALIYRESMFKVNGGIVSDSMPHKTKPTIKIA